MEPISEPRRLHEVTMPRATRMLLLLPMLALVAACAGASGNPSPSVAPVDSAQAAVDAIRAFTPLFDGIDQKNPDLIGQGSSWEATPLDPGSSSAGWTVTFTVGWGDCPSGCIDNHTWTWVITPDGRVPFQGETGSVLAPDVIAERNGASTVTGVGGRVGAGPTCPVEQPGDPNCAPRSVGGAVLVVQAADGSEVARLTTDGSGLFRIPLPAGDYTLAPQAVEGLMGGAKPTQFTVAQGAQTWLDVSYDTGIR